jgi:hypothetical protein
MIGIAPVWVERQRVVALHEVRTPLVTGIRFVAADDRYAGVIFWGGGSALRDSLARFGWPIDA